MLRTQVLGLGSFVPDRVVTNDDLRYLNDRHERCDEIQMETSHEWIVQRTGIEERRYVEPDGGVGTSDLGVEAAKLAIADAGIETSDIDCIVFATLSPDILFPGNAVFVQEKLGLCEAKRFCACYDIRQQCSGFLYGMQMADAFVRTGMYKRVLLIGSEIHSHTMDYSTRGRDVTVLFGDGAGAMILGPEETEDPNSGVVYTDVHADGRGAMHLYLKVFDVSKVPFIWYDSRNEEENLPRYPQMNGKAVYINAVRRMTEACAKALATSKMTWDDIDWFVPHQANLRINQKVAELAKIPADKVLNTIQFYGNTTAATIPLTIDYWRKQGKVKKGDRVLSAVFGSGFTWGGAIFQV